MELLNRRYDIDWLRVIAIGLLLIYHVAIGFQPWGIMIGFITNDEPWQSLWFPMAMLNIWRIPFLFFVSGMGVYFAMQQRNWKQLVQERALRIFLPFIFGALCIFPLSVYIWKRYYHWDITYDVSPGHLWFLGNIFAYVLILAPLLYYIRSKRDGKFVRSLTSLISTPLGLIPVVGIFIAEAMIVKPNPYELYAMTWHGFILGFLAFFIGFCFVLCGDGFWKMILRYRWMFVALAASLFTIRLTLFGTNVPGYLLATESNCWIFSVFAFGFRYLNRSSKTLSYLSQAAYPVYILHMIFLFLGSAWIFPLKMAVQFKFALVLVITFAGCFAALELIKQVNILRPLFGLKMKEKKLNKVRPDLSTT